MKTRANQARRSPPRTDAERPCAAGDASIPPFLRKERDEDNPESKSGIVPARSRKRDSAKMPEEGREMKFSAKYPDARWSIGGLKNVVVCWNDDDGGAEVGVDEVTGEPVTYRRVDWVHRIFVADFPGNEDLKVVRALKSARSRFLRDPKRVWDDTHYEGHQTSCFFRGLTKAAEIRRENGNRAIHLDAIAEAVFSGSNAKVQLPDRREEEGVGSAARAFFAMEDKFRSSRGLPLRRSFCD